MQQPSSLAFASCQKPRFALRWARVASPLLLGLGLANAGCSDAAVVPAERVGQSSNALTQAQADVLGFEVLSAWNASQGIKTLSSLNSQGQQALSLKADGWTELESIPLASLGTSPDVLTVDIRLPAPQVNPFWYGQVLMGVTIPSLNINNRVFANAELTGKPLEQFVTLSFAVPADLKAALGKSYSDLRIKLLLNVPTGNGAYLFDNLRLGVGGGGQGPGACDPYLQVASNGDVRFSFTTLSTDSEVWLHVKKEGAPTIDRLLTPSGKSPSGTASYSFVDRASNYKFGDKVASQLSFTRATPVCPPNASPPWLVNTSYTVGVRVSYQGQVYEATRAHVGQLGAEPSVAIASWVIPNACRVSGWQANTAYLPGDRVGYGSLTFEALRAHIGASYAAPADTPDLWKVTTDNPNPPMGSGAVTLYRPGPSGADWTEQVYGVANGCTPIADRDGDGVPDKTDLCPDDPFKALSLESCGCGVAETDSDGDATPDCKDACPRDKARLAPGDCGCSDNLAPVGRFCDDGGAPGGFTCDGLGHCGPVDGGRPPFAVGVCSTLQYGDSIYLFCPNDKVSWNDAARLAPASYKIARIDSGDENVIVTSLLTNGSSASSWLDGKVTASGVVSHTGAAGQPIADLIWDEAQAPKNVGLGYFNWQAGQPAASSGSGCESLSANGTWQVGSCADLRPVVYERSRRTLTVLTTPTPIGVEEFPGLVQEPNTEPGAEACSNFTDDTKCADCLADPTKKQDDCLAMCKSGTCAVCLATHETTPDLCVDKCTPCDLCLARTENPGSSCDSVCQTGHATSCTHKYGAFCEVAALDQGHTVPCQKLACPPDQPNCTPQYGCPLSPGATCGVLKGSCPACGDGSKPCPTQCSTFVCGTVVNPNCGLDRTGDGPCREELACTDDRALAGTDELKSDMLSLTEPGTPQFKVPLPPPPLPAADKYRDADQEATDSTPLAKAWCQYTTPSPSDSNISDGKAADAGKKSNKALQFSLDPNVTLDYHLDALALGQVKFKIDAAARLLAHAEVDFAGIKSGFDVLDAQVAAHANRCGYSMKDSKLVLFSKDFLPDLLGSDFEGLLKGSEVPGCEQALVAYQEVADRTKKAMRDAQELLRQYHKALEQGACLDTVQLCTDLMKKAPTGFVKLDCSARGLKVEHIINLFIFNYERSLLGNFQLPTNLPELPTVTWPAFPDVRLKSPSFDPKAGLDFGDFGKLGALPSLSAAGAELGKLRPDTGKLRPNWKDDYGCGGSAKTEVSTLFTKPFTLGPIPMLLEVQSVVKYGIGGDLDFSFQPDKLVQLATGSGTDVTVASVSANATPCVSAGLGLFVGAGFKGYGFRATAGVEGVVNLGTVSAPAQATAYINISAEDEAIGLTKRPVTTSGTNSAVTAFRELPDDLKGLWDGKELPIKQRRYAVKLGYKYGLSVGIDQILAGHLKADLQIKFLFFKKRWSKYLINFGNGFSLGKHRLIGGEGDVALEAKLPWATLQAPSPFVNFRYLEALPQNIIAATPDQLPSFDIPVAQLGSLGWDTKRFHDIELSPEDLSGLGGLAAALKAKGVDVTKLNLADLTQLGITLDKLKALPLKVEDLDALKLSVTDLATLGIELPRLASDRLDLRGFSVSHLGMLDLPSTRLGKIAVDWRDLPELSYRLRKTELAQALRNAGVDLANLTLPDFFKLPGITIDSFRGWPLTAGHVVALGLTTAELKKMGVNLTGFDLRIDQDPSALSERGLDLSALSLASLGQLGLDLSKLGAVAVDSERLLALNTALGYADIRTALAAAGVPDLNHVKLSDLGKLEDKLDGVSGTLSSSVLKLGTSELVKLGFGQQLALLPDLNGVCDLRPLDTSRVGKFFYEAACNCRKPFDASLPYAQGEQSCGVDADCCPSAQYCNGDIKPGYKVCSSVRGTVCGPSQSFTETVPDRSRLIPNANPNVEKETGHIAKTFASRPCDFRVYLESREGEIGSFDDRGLVSRPDSVMPDRQITDEAICHSARVGHLLGRVDVTDHVIRNGNALEFDIRAEDMCGVHIGWSGLQVTYEVTLTQ